MPLEIRLIRDSEYRAVNDFFNKTRSINLPAKKAIREYAKFCWEFLDCTDRKAIFAGAWDLEDIDNPVLSGIQGIIIHKMISSDGKSYLAAKGEDALIEINALMKFKNSDILKALCALLVEECRKRSVVYLWGFNNLPATYKRLGFVTPFKSFNGVLVLNPVKTYKNIITLKAEHNAISKFKIAFLTVSSYLYSLKKAFIPSLENDYQITRCLDDNTDLFRRAAAPGRLFTLLQDSDYMKWRISENPYAVKYRSWQLRDRQNNLHAQVICSILDNAAFIEQILFDHKLEMTSLNFLLKKIIRSLKNEKVIVVRYMGFRNNELNKKEMDVLKKLGFAFSGNGEWFTYKPLTDDPAITPDTIYLSRIYKQGRT